MLIYLECLIYMFIFIDMSGFFPAYMYIQSTCLLPKGPKMGTGVPGTEVIHSFKLLCGS